MPGRVRRSSINRRGALDDVAKSAVKNHRLLGIELTGMNIGATIVSQFNPCRSRVIAKGDPENRLRLLEVATVKLGLLSASWDVSLVGDPAPLSPLTGGGRDALEISLEDGS